MKRSLLYVLILICILINYFLVFLLKIYRENNEKFEFLVEKALTNKSELYSKYEVVTFNHLNQISNKDEQLDDFDLFDYNSNLKVKFSDFFRKNRSEKLFVIRVDELDCSKCIQKVINDLNRIKIEKDKILILTNYSDYSEFKSIFKNLAYKVYYVESIGLSIEDFNLSFLTLVDKNLICKDILHITESLESIRFKI